MQFCGCSWASVFGFLLSKSDICKILPDISPSTVELVIGSMVKRGVLRRLGQGRGVKYLR